MSDQNISNLITDDINLTEINVTNEGIPLLTQELHESISTQSLKLANKIYDDWYKREKDEKGQRENQLKWIKNVLFWQMVAASVLFIVDSLYQVNIAILIGLITAIIIEFIGLISIMVTYFYSERSTKSLDVVAKIMGDVGINNVKYDKNQ